MMRPPSYMRAAHVAEAAPTVAADRRRSLLASGTTEVDLIGANVGAVRPARLCAVASAFLAAGVVLGMLLDPRLRTHLSPAHQGTIVARVVVLAVALAVLLTVESDARHVSRGRAEEWGSPVGLDAMGVSGIVHVPIGRRWRVAGAGRP